MNKTVSEASELITGLKEKVAAVKDREIVVCPPFTDLAVVRQVIVGSNIKLGAQNMYWEDEGAFTGEISPAMLKSAGCEYVIIGHSERRQYFNETNETVNKKIKKALSIELIPIVCVGETLEQREKELTFKVVETQIREGLKDLGIEDIRKLVIAYEPIWAIGTGRTATPEQAEEVHKFIRRILAKISDKDTSQEIRILYGGSMKPENISGLMKCENIDGGLIGGASLKVDSFTKIIKYDEVN